MMCGLRLPTSASCCLQMPRCPWFHGYNVQIDMYRYKVPISTDLEGGRGWMDTYIQVCTGMYRYVQIDMYRYICTDMYRYI
jgi:hypothetical protein